MEKEKNAPWLSVPQFGDWEQKGHLPDYSLDFSKIRETRKQNKRDTSRPSIGNEDELISSVKPTNAHQHQHQHQQQQQHHPHQQQQLNQHTHSPTPRKSILSYFNCCVKV